MAVEDPGLLGPLAGLVGSWEGDEGLDVSFHHVEEETIETPYREKVTFGSFGPVDNGRQSLYGLDYRMAAWRGDETDPFHTEVGYWLWDPDARQVMRCFMVPRGVVVIAGAEVAPDATTFTLRADEGAADYGILQNKYLLEASRTTHYEATITIGDGTWSYEEDTVLTMNEFDEPYHHTDRDTLRRVD